MTPKRFYYFLLVSIVLAGVGTVASGFASNLVLVQKASKLSKLKAEAQTQNELQVTLSRNKHDLKEYEELNKIAKTIVPQEKDQAITVREITRMASESGIAKLSSITFPASTLGATTGGKNLSQVTPVKGLQGVYLLPITVTLDSNSPVSYTQFTNFLRKLEQNRRTAQVSSVSITPNPSNSNQLSFNLVINKYIKL